jgi:AcrR family transcriptional regulator
MARQPAEAPRQRAKLSRTRIIDEALALIDDAGLDRFSMRALAARLGVDPMSIYHHVPSKSLILDGVLDALIREADLPGSGSLTWQEWVRTSAERFVGVASAHPEAFLIFGERDVSSVDGLKPLEALADSLIRGGFEPKDAWEIVLLFSNYVTVVGLGIARTLQAARRGVERGVVERPSLSPDEFPRLSVIARRTTTMAVFTRGIETLVAGLEVELRRSRRRARR